MASSKDMHPSARPLSQHRLSMSNGTSAAMNTRNPHSRANSHSFLAGSLNPNHRVTRRKSVTNNGANVTAISAALRDGDRSAAMPIANSVRRSTMSKAGVARATIVGSLPSPPASLPNHKSMDGVKREFVESAIDDDSNEISGDDEQDKLQKARIRRASDGQPLTKEGKRSSRVEVRCEKCGKSYKHSSCLTKHLWEHTPEWSYTSKLLISKHQQVQLLEAASVLVAMNGTPQSEDQAATPPESTKDVPSEPESTLSDPSGYSDQGDRASSADTTPPPFGDSTLFGGYSSKRITSGSNFLGSKQAARSNSSLLMHAAPARDETISSPFSEKRRASGMATSCQEDRDLAAAVELLSCSFNSNGGANAVGIPADAPPIPPVPAQYREQAQSFGNNGFINSFPSRPPESFTRGEFRRGSQSIKTVPEVQIVPDNDEDIQMDESTDEVDSENRTRSHSDDHEPVMFGMEA